MQNASSGKGKAVVYHPPSQADEAIIHFELANLLSEDQTLALNTRLGTLTLLTQDTASTRPTVLVEQQFTSGEMNILLPLFQNHPHYCPYEIILASFNTGTVTEAAIERYRLRLQEAQFAGVWDYEMRTVRNVLSRARLKLRDFGLEISSILETGYLLIALPMRRVPRDL